VGEVRVLERLVRSIKSLRPEITFTVSTYTRTGQALARDIFNDANAIFFFPIDSGRPLKRFFSGFHPDGVVIVETEIWPYFLDLCREKGIPVVLANGRLTEQSTKYYRLFRSALRRVFGAYKSFIMQTEADGRRIIAIGAAPDRVVVRGNIKYDPNPDIDMAKKRAEIRSQMGLSENQFLLVAASTRPGEEAIICDALKKISAFPEQLTVMIAPRHLERIDDVIGILRQARFEYMPFSQLEGNSDIKTPVILMDKIGLLADILYGADVAFVGGTLADLGGHNIMEPVLAGVPVLFGPSIYNVKDAAESIIEHQQGMMIHNANQMAEAINRFIDGSLQFNKKTASGSSVADRTAEIIIRELGL